MAIFEFNSTEIQTAESRNGVMNLGHAVLLRNAEWFVKVRWIIIAALTLLGLLGLLAPGLLAIFNLRPMTAWIFCLAAILMLANIFYHSVVVTLRDKDDQKADEAILWLQIIVDLTVLTLLVHITGSIETYIAFTYLFHIVLSCIFFARHFSFMVTLLAATLYMTCCAMEMRGIWSSSSMLISRPIFPDTGYMWTILYPLSAVGVFMVVWYLVSTISVQLRERELALTEANKKLKDAERAMTRRMLQTTHDLKAPFSGIETDIMVMRCQHMQEMSDSAKQMLERIETRSKTLRERIKEILLLGDLKNSSVPVEVSDVSDLSDVFRGVIADLEGKARQRDITINNDVPGICVAGEKRKLMIMFTNITGNAVTYSQPGGEVDISIEQKDDGVCVLVRDYGIGIQEAALPRIFEEFYNAKEAVRFNKQSTGLGLAIVKEIAVASGYRIEVESKPDEGTTFRVHLGKAKSEASKTVEGTKKIQIIDDEIELANNLKIILEEQGYDVAVFDQLEGAIEELLRNKPDALLLDVMFPGYPSGGFELAREIQLREEIKDLPVILLTGMNKELTVHFSADDISKDWMPVTDFIEKPANPELLLAKLNQLLGT